MTEIVFIFDSNHKYKGFRTFGHSGYAKRGKDIVCSAISVLTINTINCLEKIALEETIVETRAKDAYMSCFLKNVPTDTTETLFKALDLGVTGIMDNYGCKYCKVTYEEEEKC